MHCAMLCVRFEARACFTVSHVCRAHARPCLSTGWVLNRRFDLTSGTTAVLAQRGGGVPVFPTQHSCACTKCSPLSVNSQPFFNGNGYSQTQSNLDTETTNRSITPFTTRKRGQGKELSKQKFKTFQTLKTTTGLVKTRPIRSKGRSPAWRVGRVYIRWYIKTRDVNVRPAA